MLKVTERNYRESQDLENHTNRILGSHCGSKYINDALQPKVLEILKHETYLETNGQALENIVNKSVMYQFETETKQTFRVEDQWVGFMIEGLRPNKDKGFEKSELHIPRLAFAFC